MAKSSHCLSNPFGGRLFHPKPPLFGRESEESELHFCRTTVIRQGEQRGRETTALGEFHQMGYKWPFIQLNGKQMPMSVNGFHPL